MTNPSSSSLAASTSGKSLSLAEKHGDGFDTMRVWTTCFTDDAQLLKNPDMGLYQEDDSICEYGDEGNQEGEFVNPVVLGKCHLEDEQFDNKVLEEWRTLIGGMMKFQGKAFEREWRDKFRGAI